MKKQKKNTRLQKKSLSEHLDEIKKRFLIWLALFILFSLIGYYLYQPLLNWLIAPLGGPLFYTSPGGALQTVFTVLFLFGFITSLPVLLYQVVRFLEPAVSKSLDHIYYYVLVSFFLAISGVLIAYYLILPATLQFLANFSDGQLKALISTKEYFSFVTKYFLGFAIFFQFPVIVYIVNKFVKLSAKSFLKYWRHMVVVSFIVAAVLTPTLDPVNLTIMAAPIIILYFISAAVLAFGS